MGTADVIPGVSGGTIALITGIYERLIHAISRIDFKFILYLLEGDWKRFKENALNEIDFSICSSHSIFRYWPGVFLTMSKVISYLLAAYPAVTYAFFFGFNTFQAHSLSTNRWVVYPLKM
jgi:Predicted membrane protein